MACAPFLTREKFSRGNWLNYIFSGLSREGPRCALTCFMQDLLTRTCNFYHFFFLRVGGSVLMYLDERIVEFKK